VPERRLPSRALLTVLGLLAAVATGLSACGNPPPPPPPDPPRVTVAPERSSVADTHLAVNINVSGCAAVKHLSLWNRDAHVGDVTWAGNPTRVEIQPNQLRYTGGLAANLALVAKVVCDDDRQNESSPVGVRFLPVAEVVKAQPGSQVVTDVFFAEGQGANVGFLGCSGNAATGGTAFARVNRSGEVVAFNSALPFPCTAATWVTDLHLASFKRWAVEPGVGAFAFHPGTLAVTAFHLGNVRFLSVGPDGDAVIHTAGGNGDFQRVIRLAHDGSGERWAQPFGPAGTVMGNPGIHATLGVYLPVFVDQMGMYQGTVAVQRVDYDSGGAVGAVLPMKIIQYGLGDIPPIPPAAFNADASIVYFPFQTQPGATTVLACATNATGCTGNSLRWQSPTLTGNVLLTVPFHGHSVLAAVSHPFTWFLDSSTGVVLNKDQKAVSPSGALVTMGVQPGRGRDFYLLNGSGQPGTLPSEIVAVDAPEFGPLFRYGINGSHLMAGVDDGGQLWLRVARDLVRPLPLAEYQLVVER
jgi:hypothetical protein